MCYCTLGENVQVCLKNCTIFNFMSAFPSDGGSSSSSVSEGDPELDRGLLQEQSPGLDSGSRRMGKFSGLTFTSLFFYQGWEWPLLWRSGPGLCSVTQTCLASLPLL